MYKNIPSEPKVREMIIEELKKRKENSKVNNPSKKSKRKSVEIIFKNKNLKSDSINRIFIRSSESFNNSNKVKQKYLIVDDETKKKKKEKIIKIKIKQEDIQFFYQK